MKSVIDWVLKAKRWLISSTSRSDPPSRRQLVTMSDGDPGVFDRRALLRGAAGAAALGGVATLLATHPGGMIERIARLETCPTCQKIRIDPPEPWSCQCRTKPQILFDRESWEERPSGIVVFRGLILEKRWQYSQGGSIQKIHYLIEDEASGVAIPVTKRFDPEDGRMIVSGEEDSDNPFLRFSQEEIHEWIHDSRFHAWPLRADHHRDHRRAPIRFSASQAREELGIGHGGVQEGSEVRNG